MGLEPPMEAPIVAELREQAAEWRFLHDLFRFPSREQWTWLREAAVEEGWRLLVSRSAPNRPRELPLPSDSAEYEQTFIATFEVGLPSPPCPLIESHWNSAHPVPHVLHENMLFFRRFGLELRSSANEAADHLRHQLEFLHYLCRLEADAHEVGDADRAGQIALARVEYLDRHVRCWVPAAAAAAQRVVLDGWPAQWMGLLADFAGPTT